MASHIIVPISNVTLALYVIVHPPSMVQRFNLLVGLYTLGLCGICFFINQHYFHFATGIYAPAKLVISTSLTLIILRLGARIAQWPTLERYVKHFSTTYLTVFVIFLLTEVSQWTPFNPIDAYLIHIDHHLGFDSAKTLTWVATHPYLHALLNMAYASLTMELTLALLTTVWIDDSQWQQRYLGLYLLTALIGFTCYYFFPTTAPANNIRSPFFIDEQHYTAVKFAMIHAGIQPDAPTLGGMVAMPSFHAIWTIICQTQWQRWPLFARAMLPWNATILLSCVLLGWHYLVDLLASAAIVSVSWLVIHKIESQNCK